MNIIDRGENDPIPFELTDTDRAISDATRHAIAEQRYYLNTQERVRKEQAKARALYEQAERDYHHHNPNLDGQS
jgi:hypothetical protein